MQGAIRIQEKNIIIKELKDDKTKLETELEDVEKKKSKGKSWRHQGQVRRKDFFDNLKTSFQEQNFVCDKCDVRFETMADLKNHERIIHMNGFSSQTENKVLVDKKVKYDKLVFSSDKNSIVTSLSTTTTSPRTSTEAQRYQNQYLPNMWSSYLLCT